MPIGFGFGVGDFVTTINLFKEIAVALKDHGGALDDYQKTLNHLESLCAILECLADISDPTKNSASLNAISRSAQRIKDEVDNFLTGITKYKARFESRNLAGPLIRATAKIEWSQYVATQVTKVYVDVDCETNKLRLLLDYHNL